jgi:receptor protein-tyrosine kinase
MELSAYLRILARRWPVVIALPVLVLLFAVYQETGRTPTYSSTARLSVVRMPDNAPPTQYQYDEYYNYLSSEFAIDDLVEIVRGNVFANAVAEALQAAGWNLSGGDVQGALGVSRQHRILSVTATSAEPERATAIAVAAAAELEQNAARYLGPPDIDMPAIVRPVQVPTGAAPDTQRTRLILLMTLVVALGVGVLLAFFVDYLDDTLYDLDAVQAVMRLPHLTTVTGKRR